jgi:hypothetical protein
MMGWIDVKNELPAVGQRVLLEINGIVQNEIFIFDSADVGDYSTPEYFWSRDDIDECPKVEDGQHWMPLPEPPK